ncbi:ASCH domain-containing protein [Candidatus Saccharibacteria bacterium]|nr:ASCH domain-containing protein [Candidatus Saccharibacteria bacterium]
MNLQRKYLDYIKNGAKRVEMRLFDEKRSKIQIGDKIEFGISGEDGGEVIRAKVIELLKYRSFEDLVEDFPIEMLAGVGMTKAELAADLDEFYPKGMQEKYGVVGIRFELIA